MSRFYGMNIDTSKVLKARIDSRQDCVLSGIDEAVKVAESVGVTVKTFKHEGDTILRGETVAELIGDPVQLVSLKDNMLCYIAKASSVATESRKAVLYAKDRIEIVVSVSKVIPEQRELMRQAVRSGGGRTQMAKPPSVFVDKNIIAVFGSVADALANIDKTASSTVIVSIRGGRNDSVEEQTREAVRGGADILFLDGGNIYDLDRCVRELKLSRTRTDVKLAFAGGLDISGISGLITRGIDIAVLGRSIIDAPMMDFSYDVYYGG